jgi:hypothetical protein
MTSFARSSQDPRTVARAAAPAREALDRTMRLMRDNLVAAVSDETLLAALLAPRVLIAADERTLGSAAAQTAFVTTALLLLRTGATLVIAAPNVPVLDPQPPLTGHRLVDALVDVGDDLIEGVRCLSVGDAGDDGYDAVILIGPAPAGLHTPPRAGQPAPLILYLGADAVSGRIVGVTGAESMSRTALAASMWRARIRAPFGALAAAGLAAGEIFKLVMRSLADYADATEHFTELFAVTDDAVLSLDPAGEVAPAMLATLDALGGIGAIDVVSGGAIAQSFLYSMARVPGARGNVRVIEPETSDASNLNRYALLRRSALGDPKATTLAAMPLGGLRVTPVVARYDRATPTALGGLAPVIVVGVDDIPTRWAAQEARPQWLGVGATSHYSAMSSDHARGTPCTWCLHPADAPDIGPIPTVAFVSHWAGLLLAWRFVRHRLGLGVSLAAQYDFFTPLRADLAQARWRSPVAPRPDCPNQCVRLQHEAA